MGTSKDVVVSSGHEATVAGALGSTMSRRQAVRLLGAAGIATVVAGGMTLDRVGAAQQLVTTTALNLRAKPRSDAKVLRVMPEGSVVTRIGGGAGRYVKVIFDGTRGYAHLDYLNDADHHQPDSGFAYPSITTTDVNLRSGPSTSHSVLRVLGVGTELMSSDRVENGYRNVLHKASGAKGWVWDAYVSDGRNGGDGGSGVRLTTTAAVNHRTSPSTSASIITVIPAGATVYGLGESSNGFEKVRYNNKTGWVYAAYLR